MDPVSSHSCHLLQQLHEQRIQGLLCDCMLVVKGVCFKAHKNVLAAFSQYFRCLFQNSPSQKNEVFNLDIKNIGGIGQILDFMYTSHLDLNQDNVQAMMDIAQYLQVHIVLNMCHTFLKPTVVESSRISNSNDFPLLRSSIIDSDCFLSEQSKADSLQDFVTHCHSQTSNVAGNQPLDSEHCEKLYESSTSCSKQRTELTGHHYKLRNFFSKQSKQNLNVKKDSKSGHLAPLIECAVLHQEHSHSWNASTSECIPESIKALPSNFSAGSINENTVEQEPESTSCQSMMRLKKAVHLKKLNFLRSQEALELLHSEPEADDQSLRSDFVVGNTVPTDDNTIVHSIEKETILPFSFNDSEQSIEVESYQSTSESNDNPRPSELQRLYDCDLCGKNFKHPSNLELHKRSHTGEKPFECVVCGKRFSQAGNLQTHLRRHSGEKPYICEICGKRFAASGDVQRHIVIHTGEKPHLCDACGRGFSNFSNLKEHKKTHATDKVFTCDECGKSFNMYQKLIKHGIRHTGERPYSCSACGKRFAGSGDLRRHLRTHTGEKPYACESCNKCFSRPAVLRRHKRTHCKATEDETTTVQEEFSQIMDMSDHEKSESNDSFTKNISVTSLPVLTRISNVSRTEIDKSSTDFNCKTQSVIEHYKVSKCDKLSSKTSEVNRQPVQPASPPQSYNYDETDVRSPTEPMRSDSPVMVRSSLGIMNTHCNEPENNLATPVAYRNSEGPFCSSMTLWGFAMKTLQDQSELDQ